MREERKRVVLALKQRSFFLVFFLPTFVVLLFFSLFAMFGVIGLSFFHIDLKHALSALSGASFSNYLRLLTDVRFWTSVKTFDSSGVLRPPSVPWQSGC